MWNSNPMTVPMMTRRWAEALILTAAAVPAAASAGTCRTQDEAGVSYAICEVHAGDELRLWLTGPDGQPMGTFDRLRQTVTDAGGALIFAMNAGMYHPDRRPVGLYVEQGAERAPVVTAGSAGNFGMRPNGVFCIAADGFRIIESRQFADAPPPCRYATQSGPMLVIAGALHPRFIEGSDSRHIRNGVGVAPDGKTAWFAISDRPVTFFDFASLFRDVLKTPDALFLDGSISRLYSAELGRDDVGFPMGPMVGLVAPRG
jgi:uncharacterized protein YigE (DUF2233 family)